MLSASTTTELEGTTMNSLSATINMSRSASLVVESEPLSLTNILSEIVQNCSNVNNSSEMKVQHLLDVISCLEIAHSLDCDAEWVTGCLSKKLLLIEGFKAMDDELADEDNPLNCIAIDSEIIEVLILTFKSYKTLRKSLEPLVDCIHLLCCSLGFPISYYNLVLVFGVVDQLKKYSLGIEERHGALRSYMWSYFNVLCDVLNHVQLSKSKFEIILEKHVDPIIVKVEGELRTQNGTTFLLFEEMKHHHLIQSNTWENTSTLKMILSLKSLLRRNLNKCKSNNEEHFQRNSTVIGVSYSKQLIHMFVLRAFLSENNEPSNEVNVTIRIYYKKYRVRSENDMLILWVDILNFSKIFLSSTSSSSLLNTGNDMYELKYWDLEPFIDSRSDEDDILFKIQNQLKKLCLVPNMAINKKIISEAKNEIGYNCKIQNTTFVKRIEKEEKYIISKLLESRDSSRCLPQVINMYNSFIEYEELLPLPTRLSEPDLFHLCMDICHALDSLHSLNIIHRDVKIQNIMIRKPYNNSALQRYVLIDFSMSYHFEKTDQGYVDTFTRSLANENYGTNSYKAPEVLSSQIYGESIDVFSLAASILCSLDRKRYVCSKKENLQHVVDGLVWKNKRLKQVIRMMVNTNPHERPTPKQVLEILSQEPSVDISVIETEMVNVPNQNGLDNVQEEIVRTLSSTPSEQALVEAVLLRDEEPCKFFTPSKRDSDSDDEDYDSDDSLSPIYSTRTPIFERSEFEFD